MDAGRPGRCSANMSTTSRAATMMEKPNQCGGMAALTLIQQANGFEERVAGDGQAFRAELVQRVLVSVPVRIVVAVVEIDQVSAGHASLHEGDVVVLVARLLSKEIRLPAVFRGGLVNQVLQPGRGVQVALDVQIF